MGYAFTSAADHKEKLIEIRAKVVNCGSYTATQMAGVVIPSNLFAGIQWLIVELRPPAATSGVLADR
jgi:hypothetical protein